jgi:hypothetical protein
MRLYSVLMVGALVLPARVAWSSPWVTGELPAAFAVTSQQESYFRPGAMPSLAAFFPVASHAAVGLRMRFGMLADSPSHPVGVVDPGPGGLITGMIAARFDAADTWIELDAGGGVTGMDAVPAWEIGVGHDFVVGELEVGPMLRYLRVMGSDPMPMIDRGPASIVLLGVEARTGVRHSPRVVVDVVTAPPAPEPVADATTAAQAPRRPIATATASPTRSISVRTSPRRSTASTTPTAAPIRDCSRCTTIGSCSRSACCSTSTARASSTARGR